MKKDNRIKFLWLALLVDVLCFFLGSVVATSMMKSTDPTMYWLGVSAVVIPILMVFVLAIMAIVTSKRR